MSSLLLIALLTSSTAQSVHPQSTSAEAKAQIRTAIGQILQGRGVDARSTLQMLPEDALNAKDRDFRLCTLSRLRAAEPSAASGVRQTLVDAFARNVLQHYRAYWQRSVMNEGDRGSSEQALLKNLSRLVRQPKLKSLDEVEPIVEARLKARGLFSQSGQTGVLRDMMIWSRDTLKVEEVPLPEGSFPTRVRYLDNFLSRGWSSYLSCDRTGTGGWTTDEGLFVVVPSYDSLEDENFRINFLAHESQHYSDKKRFGNLPGWRLEFRAKLVELAYANATRNKILDNFASNLGDDPSDPHSYANRKVLEAITIRLMLAKDAKLQSTPTDDLQRAAIDELKADTLSLKAQMQSHK